MKLTPCSCGLQYLVRLNRALWMRCIPTRRHYFCAKCKPRQLLPRSAFASWWLPSHPQADAVSSLPPIDAEPRGLQMRAQR